MSLAHSAALNGRREKSTRRTDKSSGRKQRVLAAVDGSEQTNDVVRYLLDLADRTGVEIVLLNVQPEPEDWRLRGYGSFKRDEIRHRLVNDRGKPVVDAVGRTLEKAGIRYKEQIRIGDFAAEAARLAKKEHCDLIVMGEPRAGGFGGWLARATGISLGSLSSRVVQLAETPVVIVR